MKHPSRYELDKYVAKESSKDLSAHIDACDTCRAYISRRREEQSILMAQMPVEQFLRRISERTEKGLVSKPLVWRLGFATMAAAVIAAIIFGVRYLNVDTGQNGRSSSSEPLEEMRWMGNRFATRVYVKRGRNVFVHGDTWVKPGDRVRYEVVADSGHPAFAAVVAIEGEDVLVVLPSDTSQAARVNGKTEIPGSVDIGGDAENTEILLIVRDTPFSLDSLRTEIRNHLRNHNDISALTGIRNRLKVSR